MIRSFLIALAFTGSVLAQDPAVPGEQYPQIITVSQVYTNKSKDTFTQVALTGYFQVPRNGELTLRYSTDGKTWKTASQVVPIVSQDGSQEDFAYFDFEGEETTYYCRLILTCPSFDGLSILADDYYFFASKK